jgi:hypothetical protein
MFMPGMFMPAVEPPPETALRALFASLRASCAETPIHTATVPSTTTSRPSRSENAAQNPLLSFSLAGGL